MLNIEKYEEELRPFGTCFAITKDGKIKNCKGFRCGACAFHDVPDSNCNESRFEWLMKEYKEPILTNEEKVIIKDLIKAFEPFGKKLSYIAKKECYSNTRKHYLVFRYKNASFCTLDFNNDELFEGMESDVDYTLEELGL